MGYVVVSSIHVELATVLARCVPEHWAGDQQSIEPSAEGTANPIGAGGFVEDMVRCSRVHLNRRRIGDTLLGAALHVSRDKHERHPRIEQIGDTAEGGRKEPVVKLGKDLQRCEDGHTPENDGQNGGQAQAEKDEKLAARQVHAPADRIGARSALDDGY